MYTLINAVKRKTKYNGNWETFDIGNEPIGGINERLGWVVIELKPQNSSKNRWVNLINLEIDFTAVDPNITFNEWLVSIGDQNLPFNSEDFYEKNYVKYVQAWHAGYNFQPVHPTINPSVDISIYEKADLIVTNEKIDPEYLGKYGLFTVNGLFHISYYGKDELRIKDGFKSILKFNDNQIGLYSFEALGQINCLPIDTSFLTKTDNASRYYDNTFITIPESVDITNKSVLFVIGGYLYFCGKEITRVNDRSYSIKFNNILTLDRYFQMNDRLNIEDWELTIDNENPNRINIADLYLDSTILKLLGMSQSFIVVVDTPTIKQNLCPVEYIKLPGRYVDSYSTKLPLVGNNGISVDYHTIKEDILTVLATSRNGKFKYITNTLDWTKARYVDNGKYPYSPYKDESVNYRLISN